VPPSVRERLRHGEAVFPEHHRVRAVDENFGVPPPCLSGRWKAFSVRKWSATSAAIKTNTPVATNCS
jgi:hypothetical protein